MRAAVILDERAIERERAPKNDPLRLCIDKSGSRMEHVRAADA